ncbi:START domain-containing protein [Litorivivens sp.]|uniref:START domain-containing protein n=1 Tax=Litorivivens sp. TaxID=2020868 RepID=UPI003563F154
MRIMIFFMAMMLTSLNGVSDESWVLALDEDQLQIYTKPVPGSPFLAVKGVVKINATPKQLAASLGSDNECAKWRKMCKSSRVIEQISEDERIVHTILDLPWPLSDRDVVNRVTVERCARTGRITVNAVSDPKLPPSKKYVRALSNTSIEILPVSDTATRLTLISHADMGGDLPPDRINERIPRGTLEDLRVLKSLVEGR